MKKFFTAAPLQVSGELDRYHYQAVGNARLEMEGKTCFPILTAIHGYVKPGEPFRVIAVVSDSEAGRANYQTLQDELKALCEKYGLCCAGVDGVVIPSDESVEAHANTFQKLISYMEDEDELFACITYGDKPISMMVRMAVQYAYRVMRNTTIDCIVYGQRDWNADTAAVYDETGLVRLDEIVRLMADQKIVNPKGILRDIFAL